MGDATINRDEEVLYTTTTYQVQQEPWQSSKSFESRSNTSQTVSNSITEEEVMAVRREIERSVEGRVEMAKRQTQQSYQGTSQQYHLISTSEQSTALRHPIRTVSSSAREVVTMSSGERVRMDGQAVPITPARDRGRKVGT